MTLGDGLASGRQAQQPAAAPAELAGLISHATTAAA